LKFADPDAVAVCMCIEVAQRLHVKLSICPGAGAETSRTAGAAYDLCVAQNMSESQISNAASPCEAGLLNSSKWLRYMDYLFAIGLGTELE